MSRATTPPAAVVALLRSSPVASAFATTTVGALFATELLRSLMGDAGYGAIMVGLSVIGAAMLVARRREWRWFELIPTTLVALMLWLLVTTVWGRETGESVIGWFALAAPTFLAVVVAQFRDTLQTVRTTGDVLVLVRRTPTRRRPTVQWVIGSLVVVGLVLVYVLRRPLVYWLNAEPDFLTRSRLWNEILDLSEVRPVQGWGWVGTWPDGIMPFTYLRYLTGTDHGSALNAWMDMLLQAGAVGVVLLLAFAGLALARSWRTASERRSTVYVWAPLVLITLLADSIVTSALLGGFNWFLLVVCATFAT